MADASGTIKLSLDDADVAKRLAEIIARLDQMAASTPRVAAGLNQVTSSSHNAAAGHAHHTEELSKTAEAAEKLKGNLSSLSGVTNLVSEVFEKFGLEAGNISSNINFIGESIEGMAKAAGPLLALGAAVTVVGIAFNSFAEFVKDGIQAASDAQTQLQTLKAAVETQKGSWAEASEAVEKYGDIATYVFGSTHFDVESGMNRLVTAGNSVKDAFTIMGVAMEVAKSTHQDLKTVIEDLIGGEENHYKALDKLDGRLKAVRDAGGNFHDVLVQLDKDHSKAVGSSDDLATAQAREKAAFEHAAQALGETLIPLLTGWATIMTGVAIQSENAARKIVLSWYAVSDAIKGALAEVRGVANFTGLGGGAYSKSQFKLGNDLLAQAKSESNKSDAVQDYNPLNLVDDYKIAVRKIGDMVKLLAQENKKNLGQSFTGLARVHGGV